VAERDAPRDDGDSAPAAPRPHHDPAAPHTAPFPTHVPRWLAWLVLLALAASGAVCTGLVIGG
jgi:hypothetical protein